MARPAVKRRQRSIAFVADKDSMGGAIDRDPMGSSPDGDPEALPEIPGIEGRNEGAPLIRRIEMPKLGVHRQMSGPRRQRDGPNLLPV